MAGPLTMMWTYPWDLWDEGIDEALTAIADRARAKEVGVAVAYHSGTFFLPHNPRHQFYYGEDGRVYFPPESRRYAGARLRPHAALVAHGHPGSHSARKDFVAQMLVCRDAGADGFGCYNYGLVRPAHLEWLAAAAAAWETSGLAV